MLKRILFTGFSYLLFNSSFSQTISHQRKEDLNIKKFHQTVITFNSPEDYISIPIHSISVVDARPDSSAIGLYQLFKLDPRFIVTPASFGTETEPIHKKICALLEIRFVFSSDGIEKMLDFDKRA